MFTTRNHWVQGVAATLGLGLILTGPGAAISQEAAKSEALFRQLDTSGDGVLTMDEATVGTRSFLDRIFKEAGKKPTDRLTRDEFVAAQERLRSKSASGSAKSPSSTEPTRASGDAPPAGIGFIDSDGNDLVSRTEWSKFTQMFSRLDADKDNSLSETELAATGGAAELLMKLTDANGDSKLSRAEWAKLVQSFARLDANKDSSLDVAEMEKVADATVASASGSASLSSGTSNSGNKAGPSVWRGNIENRSQIELTINGNTIVGREFKQGGGGGNSLGAGTFSMTGDGKSGNMDAVYTEGNQAGEVCLGIYKIEGDTLTWCVNNRGGRPTSLSPGQARGNWLMTLTRVTGQ